MREAKGSRAATVARWFGVDVAGAGAPDPVGVVPRIPLRGGTIVLITGPSGAGKSTLLRRLHARGQRRARWIALESIGLPDALVVDAMTDAAGGGDDEPAIAAALEALSRVGLGEVWTYLRRATDLSEGQRWRLRLALALARLDQKRGRGPFPSSVLCADEFAALLDRVTAMVVARALRKAIDARPNVCAVIATSHDDLAAALEPDVVVRCDFGTVQTSQTRKGNDHVRQA